MEATNTFDQIGQLLSQKNRSSMFGVPCYKLGRKPFIMFYENQIVCKLFGEIHEEAMTLEGATLFNPKGNDKPMKNWVQLPFLHADRWEYFANLAHEFVKFP